MSEFLDDLKKDWDKFKQKVHDDIEEDNKEENQMFDYSYTGNPDEVLSESVYADPRAQKAVTEAMDAYRKSVEQKESK